MIEYKINSCNHSIKDFVKEVALKEFNIDYWDEWLEKQSYDELSVKPNIMVSAEKDNELIGICSIKELSKDECLLNSFYVKKNYRNRGIGSKLFNICEDYATKYKKIVLCVDPNFKDAITFYEKRNYIFEYYDDNRKELHYYKKKKEAIIFDLDGTLWDTTNQTYISFNNVLRKYGYDEVTKKKVSDNFGNNKEQSINHFFPNLTFDVANNLIDEIDNNIIENLDKNNNIIYNGVGEVLNILSKKYALFIVSNSAHCSYIERFLKMGNYFNYFEDYIAASEVSMLKSDAIKKIIKGNRVDIAIYVGDTDKDKESARINNIPFIQCLYGFGKDLNCKYKINNIRELPECVESIFNNIGVDRDE